VFKKGDLLVECY